MKSALQGNVVGIPISSIAYSLERSSKGLLTDAAVQYNIDQTSEDRFSTPKKVHLKLIKLGPKITETLKGKLSLGVRILQVGGVEKIFKKLFSVIEGEKLLKGFQCYLSTTAGPLAGLIFISTHKIAFCSQKSIKFSSPNGEVIRVRYKVVIPVNKVKSANQTENVKKPSQKYIEIVTVDNFDFWFMGFTNNKKAFKSLQQAISQA
ncbi:hypothetical protein UlMin_010765 [Ulmus minor]